MLKSDSLLRYTLKSLRKQSLFFCVDVIEDNIKQKSSTPFLSIVTCLCIRVYHQCEYLCIQNGECGTLFDLWIYRNFLPVGENIRILLGIEKLRRRRSCDFYVYTKFTSRSLCAGFLFSCSLVTLGNSHFNFRGWICLLFFWQITNCISFVAKIHHMRRRSCATVKLVCEMSFFLKHFNRYWCVGWNWFIFVYFVPRWLRT